MLPDRVSNPGPLTYESGALPIALRGPAPFFHYGASYMRATSTVKTLSFWTVHPDKQCKLRSACSLGIGVTWVYTVAIPSVHCRRLAITG